MIFRASGGNSKNGPDPSQLELILDCEERADRSDPYRAVAALLHVIAQRSGAG
jgi:S-adenosylmethionine-dependent methyltransferase